MSGGPILAVVEDRDTVTVLAVINELVDRAFELVALPGGIPCRWPSMNTKRRIVSGKVRVERQREFEFEQLVSFLPFDVAVESEQTQRRCGVRSGASVQGNLGKPIALSDLELALDCHSLRSMGSHVTRCELEVLEGIEIVLLDSPRTTEEVRCLVQLL